MNERAKVRKIQDFIAQALGELILPSNGSRSPNDLMETLKTECWYKNTRIHVNAVITIYKTRIRALTPTKKNKHWYEQRTMAS